MVSTLHREGMTVISNNSRQLTAIMVITGKNQAVKSICTFIALLLSLATRNASSALSTAKYELPVAQDQPTCPALVAPPTRTRCENGPSRAAEALFP